MEPENHGYKDMRSLESSKNRRKKKDGGGKGTRLRVDLFRNAACRIVDCLHLEKRRGVDKGPGKDIMALSGGRREAVREYYVEKIRIFLTLLAVMSALAAGLTVCFFAGDRSVPGGRLTRPGYGEGSGSEQLNVKIEKGQYDRSEEMTQQGGSVSGKTEEILRSGTTLSLDIPERKYSGAQERALLEQAEQEIREQLLGENPSPDRVTKRIRLPVILADGAVRAQWSQMPYGILEEDGMPAQGIPQEGTPVTLEAELTAQSLHRTVTQVVRVYPPEKSDELKARDVVRQEAGALNAGRENEEDFLLPAQVDGRQLVWTYPYNTDLLLLAMAALSIPFLAGALMDQRVKEAARMRREQLEMDYPDLLWKMTLLIGAGMNLSSAFARVAEDYRKEATGGKQGRRYVYEEMLITCHEIRDGLSEGKAYEQFGHRCGLPRYIRLGSVLSQNLRKGSRGLTEILEQEALAASRERQSQARKLGEKAGTKLLLPMVMMLCVVFVILIVPAFMAM